MLVCSSNWKCLSNLSTVIFFAAYLHFKRSFWIVCSEISSLYPGSLIERAAKAISKQIKIATFRMDHATFKFLRSWIFPVQINQMRENHLFQHINIVSLIKKRQIYLFLFYYVLISKQFSMENFALLHVLYQKNLHGKKNPPLSAFRIFVKAMAVVKAEKHVCKIHKMSTTTFINQRKNRQWLPIPTPHTVFGLLSRCFRLKNWKWWYFTFGS